MGTSCAAWPCRPAQNCAHGQYTIRQSPNAQGVCANGGTAGKILENYSLHLRWLHSSLDKMNTHMKWVEQNPVLVGFYWLSKNIMIFKVCLSLDSYKKISVLEVGSLNPGAGRCHVLWWLTSWVVDGNILSAVSLHGLFLVHKHIEQERALMSLPLPIRTLIPAWDSHPPEFI